MNITIRPAFWGDNRTAAQHRAHDHIEQARWRWRVARDIERRTLQDAQPKGWMPAFLRRQAE